MASPNTEKCAGGPFRPKGISKYLSTMSHGGISKYFPGISVAIRERKYGRNLSNRQAEATSRLVNIAWLFRDLALGKKNQSGDIRSRMYPDGIVF